MASLEDVALWASIAPMLIGTIFMVSGTQADGRKASQFGGAQVGKGSIALKLEG